MSDALLTCPTCENLILSDNEPCPYCGDFIDPGEPVSVESHVVSVASEPANLGGQLASGVSAVAGGTGTVGNPGIVGGGFDASAPLPQRLPQTQSSSLKDVFQNLPQFAEPVQPVPLTEYPQFSTIQQPNELVKTELAPPPTFATRQQPSSFTTNDIVAAGTRESASFWWGVGGFFVSIPALILAFFWRSSHPQRAKYLAIGAVLGLLFGSGGGFHLFG